MKARAGIVGPKDLVNTMKEIATEFDEQLITVPFEYLHAMEATEIVRNNQQSVDFWIFAGPALHTFVQKSGSQQPFYYLNLDGASLQKTLLEISYKDNMSLSRMSIDLLKERDVSETYRELRIPYKDIYVYEYEYDTPLDKLLSFHQDLYMKKKVDICVTCLHFIYEKLRQQGIPVYRVTPTRVNIRETFLSAIERWTTHQFKKSQIAVVLIEIQKIEQNRNSSTTISYDAHRTNLELQTAILDYAESISGSFVNLGLGSFIIFSTRGFSRETGQHIQVLLDSISLVTDLPANIGIGYGDTALKAEENARVALHHAQNYEAYCAFLVDDRDNITGPLRQEENISFSYRTEDKEISNKLKDSGVTITTFNKILSVQRRTGNHSVTTNLLADWLKMTPRNARRILTGLVEQGLAEIIGEEAPASKGRPRKIYRVTAEVNE
ncbi:putative transcriptional regulator [Bacillus freudenreichii]|nr:putative transcriptional regulator [Bacillus freudenreichii]